MRWQADGKLPKDQQRGYRGVFHALYRIARDEGVLTYWRGGGTTGGFVVVWFFVLCIVSVVVFFSSKGACKE